MSKLHTGKILHQTAKDHKNKIVKIAEDAGYTQSMFYRHTKQKDLDFSILHKYATAMDVAFEQIAGFGKYVKDKNSSAVPKAEEVEHTRAYLLGVALEATMKYNKLLEQVLNDKDKPQP